jgi:thymidylate kinase
MATKNLPILLGLCLFLVSIYLYWDTLFFSFVFFDDVKILLRQEHLFGQSSLLENVYAIAFRDLPREEPLVVRDLTWLIDSRIFGFGNAFGYHYSNVLYHGLVISCAFMFLYMLTRQLVPAMLVAVSYSVLAVHVEPVSWIMGRKDILANLFLLLLLICEIKFQRSTRLSHRYIYYGCTLLFVGLACLSKISAVVYPLIILLLKFLLPAFDCQINNPKIRIAALQALPHFVISLAVYGWYQDVLSEMRLLQKSNVFDLADYLQILAIVDPLVLLRYLKLLAYPENLSVVYTWGGFYADLTWLEDLLAIGTLVAIVALGVFLLRKRRDLLFFYLSFFVLMLPYANLVNFGWWYANRYVYASSLFLVTPIVFVCYENRRKLIGILFGAVIVVVVGYNAYVNQRQLSVWQNDETFWAYESNLPGADFGTRMRLVIYYLSKRSHSAEDQAKFWLLKAEREIENILSTYWPNRMVQPARFLYSTFYYQGVVRNYSGRQLEAQLDSFNQAYELEPDFAKTSGGLGAVHFRLALATSDDVKRQRFARASLNYYKRFFSLADQSPETRAKRDEIYEALASRFPFLAGSVPEVVRGGNSL